MAMKIWFACVKEGEGQNELMMLADCPVEIPPEDARRLSHRFQSWMSF